MEGAWQLTDRINTIPVRVRGLKVNEAHNFVTGYVYKRNHTLHRVKKPIIKIHPCQHHQLDQLLSTKREQYPRKTFIILMGTGSLSMG